MNEIMNNTNVNPLVVNYEVNGQKVSLNPQVVRQYLVQGNGNVTDQELMFFIQLCKAQKLNPFTKDVYLIKYGNSPAQMVVGKGAYMQRAYSNPNYLYKEDGIVVLNSKKEVVHKEGACVYPGEILQGAWCRVHYLRQGRECTAYREVALSEYNKGQSTWKQMPGTMIHKTAISQALREAFPMEYQGLYEETEMVASGAVPAESIPGMAKEPEQADPVILDRMHREDDPLVTMDDRKAMFAKAHEAFGQAKGNQILKELLHSTGVESTAHMRKSCFEQVMYMLDERAKEVPEETDEPTEIPEPVGAAVNP